MSKTGRGLLSLGTGVVIWFGWFGVLLIFRVVSASEWLSTALLWIMAWPLLLLNHFITIPGANSLRMALIALAVGFVADVGILSMLTYGILSLLRKRSTSSPPPSPPSFE